MLPPGAVADEGSAQGERRRPPLPLTYNALDQKRAGLTG
jgi:hypothetical protein